jgi:hypothetical protein
VRELLLLELLPHFLVKKTAAKSSAHFLNAGPNVNLFIHILHKNF